jgi:hypothetical protein
VKKDQIHFRKNDIFICFNMLYSCARFFRLWSLIYQALSKWVNTLQVLIFDSSQYPQIVLHHPGWRACKNKGEKKDLPVGSPHGILNLPLVVVKKRIPFLTILTNGSTARPPVAICKKSKTRGRLTAIPGFCSLNQFAK